MDSFSLSDQFSSFIEFDQRLKLFEKANNVLFVLRSSKKLKDPAYINTIKYEFAVFECKQGARRHKCESKGVRPNQRSFKQGCKAKIRLAADYKDGTCKLRVSTCILDHSDHIVGPEFSELYPENRRPDPNEALHDVLGMPSISAKDVSSYVQVKQNICILPKDIHNLRKKLDKTTEETESERVQKVIDEIEEGGGKAEFGTQENGTFQYLAFITQSMIETLEQFPEILVMDATYKCNSFGYALFNVLAIDGNGQGIPVFHAFLFSETSAILSLCLSFFCRCFNSTRTTTVFVDKDMAELVAIRSVLPHVSLRLCSFHASMAVKRALSERKVSSNVMNCALTLFQQQKVCETEDVYNEAREKIKDVSSPNVIAYFEENWWNCPQMWAACYSESQTFHVTTTNHAESFHQKLKTTLSTKVSLSACIQHLLSSHEYIQASRQTASRIQQMSTQYNTQHNCPTVDEIQNDLTPFGSSLVVQQLTLAKKYTYIVTYQTDSFQVCSSSTSSSSSAVYTVTEAPMKCNCTFYSSFSLPCRHIFAVRSHLKLPLYTCDNVRFKACQPVSSSVSVTTANSSSTRHVTVPTRSRAATPEEKYQLVREITRKFESFLPLLGEASVRNHVNTLSNVFDLMASDRDFAIYEIGEVVATLEGYTGAMAEGEREAPEEEERGMTEEGRRQTEGVGERLAEGAGETLELEAVRGDTVWAEGAGETLGPVSGDAGRAEEVETRPAELELGDLDDFEEGGTGSRRVQKKFCFADIRLTQPKVRGRPKQKQTFTKRYGKRKCKTPTVFQAKDQEEKKNLILAGCVVDSAHAPFKISDLKTVEKMHSLCVFVDMVIVEDLFDGEAWGALQERITSKKEKDLDECCECKVMDDGRLMMIECESCLSWYHYHCVGLRSATRPRKWFCEACWK